MRPLSSSYWTTSGSTRNSGRDGELFAVPKEIAGTVLDAMNDHFTHDVTEFTLDLDAEESVDAENTIDRLVEENEWLRRELQSAEADYMELYEEMQRTDRAVDR